MGLRDYFLATNAGLQGAESGNLALEDLRKREASRALEGNYPALVEELRSGMASGDQGAISAAYGKLLGQQSAAGQPAAGASFASQVAQSLFPKAKTGNANLDKLTEEQLVDTYGYDPEKAAAVFALPDRKAQDVAIKELGTSQRSARSFALQTEKESKQQATKAFDVLNKTEDAFRDQDFKIKEIEEALKRGGIINDNLVFGYIARSVAGEKGPLSDQDIARIQGITNIEGGVNELKSRFTGDMYQRLSPQQKDEMRRIVESSAKNFKAKKAESYAQDLSGLAQSQPRLVKDGKPTGILKQRMDAYKEEGVPVDWDKDREAFVVKKTSSELSGRKAQLLQEAQSMLKGNTAALTTLQRQLSQLPGDIDDAKASKILENIRKVTK